MRLVVLALLVPAPALALSCVRPDPLVALAEAEASPDSHVVLRGRLDFDEGAMPAPVSEGAPAPEPVAARFEGAGLGRAGFAIPIVAKVTLRPVCAGPWCGSVPTGEAWVIFARVADEGYEVEVGPCGGALFRDEPGVAEAVAACHAGGDCAPVEVAP